MTLLREIYEKYRVDNPDEMSGDKGSLHSYIDTYEEILSPFVGKEAVLLEIGVAKGLSVLMWNEYLVNGTVHRLQSITGRDRGATGAIALFYVDFTMVQNECDNRRKQKEGSCGMTVSELIEDLKKCEQESEVFFLSDGKEMVSAKKIEQWPDAIVIQGE